MTSINMMIPILESTNCGRASTARVQPKPHLMPMSQSDDNDNDDNTDTTINDNDTMALPSINIGGAEYGNEYGFTTPAIHDHGHIIRIRHRTLLPEFPALLPNNSNGNGRSSSYSKHMTMTSLKPRIRRRSISIKEKRPLLTRSA